MQTVNTRNFFLLILFCLISLSSFTQNKNCKFVKGKDELGRPVQMVAASGKIGTFYIWKSEEKYNINYATKAIFLLAADSKNQTELRIDSVRFYFTDRSAVTLPAIGKGDIQNELKLKNTFDYVQLQVPLEQVMVTRFLATKLTEIQVFGEKQAVTRDILNEKQQEKFIQAFICFQ